MRPVSSATHLADCIDGPARLQRNVVVTYLTGTFHTPPQVRPPLPNGSSSTSCNSRNSSTPPPAPQQCPSARPTVAPPLHQPQELQQPQQPQQPQQQQQPQQIGRWTQEAGWQRGGRVRRAGPLHASRAGPKPSRPPAAGPRPGPAMSVGGGEGCGGVKAQCLYQGGLRGGQGAGRCSEGVQARS